MVASDMLGLNTVVAVDSSIGSLLQVRMNESTFQTTTFRVKMTQSTQLVSFGTNHVRHGMEAQAIQGMHAVTGGYLGYPRWSQPKQG